MKLTPKMSSKTSGPQIKLPLSKWPKINWNKTTINWNKTFNNYRSKKTTTKMMNLKNQNKSKKLRRTTIFPKYFKMLTESRSIRPKITIT